MAKVLVTGGAGFIASHIVDRLINDGHEVIVVDNLLSGNRNNVNAKAKFYNLDIRNLEMEDLIADERPDVINHHAAQMSVRVSVEDPLLDADINVTGSLRIIDSAKKYGVKKIIYSSSGGTVYGEPEKLPCEETDVVKPVCQYGVSKLAVEYYLYLYSVNYGLRYTAFRYPNVYGPRQNPEGEAGVIAIFTKRMLKGDGITINGSGTQERDFVYVDDCVTANMAALDKGDGQAYNLGSGRGVSVNEIFMRLKSITNYNLDPIYGPAKKGETWKIFLDARKAERDLDWKPNVEFDDGLRRVVEYISTNEG